jgi:hypothetical protein
MRANAKIKLLTNRARKRIESSPFRLPFSLVLQRLVVNLRTGGCPLFRLLYYLLTATTSVPTVFLFFWLNPLCKKKQFWLENCLPKELIMENYVA